MNADAMNKYATNKYCFKHVNNKERKVLKQWKLVSQIPKNTVLIYQTSL